MKRPSRITQAIVILFSVGLIGLGNCGKSEQESYPSFSEAFEPVDTLFLPELVFFPTIISNLNVSRDGRIYIPDFGDQTIKIYDEKGTLQKSIGGKGKGPGEFNQLAVIDLKGDTLVALDINRRISFFNSDGEFLSSFLVTRPHHNLGIALIPNDTLLLISGLEFNAQFMIEERSKVVHMYTHTGRYIRSFHEMFSKATKFGELVALNLLSRVCVDGEGRIYVIEPVQYQVTRYDASGQNGKALIKTVPAYFHPIRENIPPDVIGQEWDTQSWWKEKPRHCLISFYLLREGFVLGVWTATPSLYTLDIYDLNGNPIKRGIRTDLYLAGTDHRGWFYFLKINPPGGYFLYRYRLR